MPPSRRSQVQDRGRKGSPAQACSMRVAALVVLSCSSHRACNRPLTAVVTATAAVKVYYGTANDIATRKYGGVLCDRCVSCFSHVRGWTIDQRLSPPVRLRRGAHRTLRIAIASCSFIRAHCATTSSTPFECVAVAAHRGVRAHFPVPFCALAPLVCTRNRAAFRAHTAAALRSPLVLPP
jgi:ribosomal protein L34E